MYQTSDSYFGVPFFQNHCQGNLKIFQEINNKNTVAYVYVEGTDSLALHYNTQETGKLLNSLNALQDWNSIWIQYVNNTELYNSHC